MGGAGDKNRQVWGREFGQLEIHPQDPKGFWESNRGRQGQGEAPTKQDHERRRTLKSSLVGSLLTRKGGGKGGVGEGRLPLVRDAGW